MSESRAEVTSINVEVEGRRLSFTLKEVTSINIEVEGRRLSLTLKEARALQVVLNDALRNVNSRGGVADEELKKIIEAYRVIPAKEYVPVYPPVYPPVFPHWEYQTIR